MAPSPLRILTLIRSAAIDLTRHRSRVDRVAPGVADTPLAELVLHDEDLAPAVPGDREQAAEDTGYGEGRT